jgi:hypothetical protein
VQARPRHGWASQALLHGGGEPPTRSRRLAPLRVSTSRKVGLPLSSAAGPLGVSWLLITTTRAE